MAQCTDLNEFQLLMTEHERIIGGILGRRSVKEELFPDYPYAIKSLGAWGGDFIMAVGDDQCRSYFKTKGYTTVLSFQEMIKD